ncbi:MAG: tetratricopeptide repeat protein [Candidatus Omnitrophica bacterium]|nr:tetratricopeptide repeat protein [Candidatus Omnitrophota bacterium]
MRKSIYLSVLLALSISGLLSFVTPCFAASEAAQYLCDFAISFYRQGKFEDALSEFNKVLLIDPQNSVARSYVDKIFSTDNKPDSVAAPEVVKPATKQQSSAPKQDLKTQRPAQGNNSAKDLVMEKTMSNLKGQAHAADNQKQSIGNLYNGNVMREPQEEPKERGIKAGPVTLSGDIQLAMGAASDNFIWKRANFDLNERFKSWRMTSDAVFNRRFNTFDPAIYDSLNLNIDTKNEQGFNFHSNITADPWSYVGKSNKITITSLTNGDQAEVQLYYWSNTGYVMNHTNYTLLNGDTFNIPEIKIKNGITVPTTVVSRRNNATFNLPAMKVYSALQPMRELWFDYNNDQVKAEVFPLGYQDRAYTSDDPMGITNHGIWWKDSKWLRMYTPGNFNVNSAPASFTKGRWDDSLSFLTKDSTGKYLTGLRGFALNFQPFETTSFDTTVATPKHLWQDYGNADNIISATRLKHYFTDKFMAGGTFTYRPGFKTQNSQDLDAQNFVGGIDLNYEIINGLKAQAEVLSSKSYYDMTSDTYDTNSRGNAYYFSLVGRYPQNDIMNLRYGYDEIKMEKEEEYLLKARFYASRMDRNFDSALSDYHNTRQDVFWSRHIHFRQPMDYYYSGLDTTPSNWDGLDASRIGDGIDVGRNTMGFRLEYLLRDKFSNLVDIRNSHDVNGKFIENVVRDEVSWRPIDRLTVKGLGIYHKLPKTTAGIDPFEYDGNTGEFFTNNTIRDGLNPTVKTGSIGFNIDLLDWMSFNGVYERTNDYDLAYGDFPRNALIDNTTMFKTFTQNDNLYRDVLPFLYGQGVFPQPPYEFYNVFKCGLRLTPFKRLQLYLDYTRNTFEAASLNSDNMNHIGLEAAYMFSKKFGLLFRYAYSRCQDLDLLQQGITELTGHNNFFGEFRYLPSADDELIFQYGAGYATSLNNLSSSDPYGGSLLTLDTQHIFRMYYRRKF